MASVKVLSATNAHAEEATNEPINKAEETAKDDAASPPPPPPPPPSEQKHTNPETEESADVSLEPETLATGIKTKAVLANDPVPEKKVPATSPKVAPEPFEDKLEENAEVSPEVEQVGEKKKVEEETEVNEDQEKVSPQVKVEKKED